MPELPEVEVIRRGIVSHLEGRRIAAAQIRNPNLRWPVAPDLDQILRGAEIGQVTRRGKYILLDCGKGTLILHLGMSGSLRLLPAAAITPPGKHDHVDLVLDNGVVLRLRDPRRFGAMLWAQSDVDAACAVGATRTRTTHGGFHRTIAVQADEGAAREHQGGTDE